MSNVSFANLGDAGSIVDTSTKWVLGLRPALSTSQDALGVFFDALIAIQQKLYKAPSLMGIKVATTNLDVEGLRAAAMAPTGPKADADLALGGPKPAGRPHPTMGPKGFRR